MLKKLSVLVLAAVVTAGVLTTGCAKKGDPKDAEALCKQTAEASIEMAMGMHPNIPKDMLKKASEDGTKQCLSSFTNLDDAEKNLRYKQAAEILKKCQGKKSKEFIDCTTEAAGGKSEPAKEAPAK